jgi:hypothetical protein
MSYDDILSAVLGSICRFGVWLGKIFPAKFSQQGFFCLQDNELTV